jgi:hypothetical protein
VVLLTSCVSHPRYRHDPQELYRLLCLAPNRFTKLGQTDAFDEYRQEFFEWKLDAIPHTSRAEWERFVRSMEAKYGPLPDTMRDVADYDRR